MRKWIIVCILLMLCLISACGSKKADHKSETVDGDDRITENSNKTKLDENEDKDKSS